MANIFTNFFQTNIKLEAYGYAVADATKAVELDGSYIKVQFPTSNWPNLQLTGAGLLEESSCQHCHPQFARSTQGLQDSRQERAEQQGREAQACGMREAGTQG